MLVFMFIRLFKFLDLSAPFRLVVVIKRTHAHSKFVCVFKLVYLS